MLVVWPRCAMLQWELKEVWSMIFSSGLGFPEGPVVLPDGSWLVVEMEPGLGCVTQISPDGATRRVIARTGRPNGLAADKSGFIWVAESSQSVLLRISTDGKVETVAIGCDGEPFLWPNDLVLRSRRRPVYDRFRRSSPGLQGRHRAPARLRNRKTGRPGISYRPAERTGAATGWRLALYQRDCIRARRKSVRQRDHDRYDLPV